MVKKTEKKKELEALRMSKRKVYCLTLSPGSVTMLENDMEKNGWTNAAAYIRYRLFGFDPETEFQKRIQSGDKKFIENSLKNELIELNKQLSYITEKFKANCDEFVEFSKDVPDTRKAAKWVSLIMSFKKDIEKRTITLMEDCLMILSALNISTDGIIGEGPKGMTQAELDKYVKNWNDSASPEVIEAGRRVMYGK